MSLAERQREEIEGLIRAWLAQMSPEDRAREGSKLVGFMAARLAFWIPDRRAVIDLFYELGDQVVISHPPPREMLS